MNRFDSIPGLEENGDGLKFGTWPELDTFEPADLAALDAANHARDLDIEHFDLSWRDRD